MGSSDRVRWWWWWCGASAVVAVGSRVPDVSAAEPAILYVPTDPVMLVPLDHCGGLGNSALGCADVDGPTEVPPYPDAVELAAAMREVLDPYDVWVTHMRPPAYLAYVMLLPSDQSNAFSQSFACMTVDANCGARQRSDVALTYRSTGHCIDSEPLHAALHAFGRVSGLEGVANPDDYMHYPPDYATRPVGYLDVCSDRVQQLGHDIEGNVVGLPLECSSLDHYECPAGANGEAQQNGHRDLVLYYGRHTEDTAAPVLSYVEPADGAVLMEGEALVVDVHVHDDDPVVGVRWTFDSQALVELIGTETYTHCTNDVCNANWGDATPLKATDSDWSITLQGLPPGEYTISVEAADYHGNTAETVTFTVTIEGETGESTGSVDETGGSGTGGSTGGVDETSGGHGTEEPPMTTTGQAMGEAGSETGGGEASDGGEGCSCRATRTPGGMALVLLGLVGMGAMCRRGRSDE